MTYCFYLQGTNSSISRINDSYEKIYNITLSIEKSGNFFNCNLTSQKNEAPVFYDDEIVGNAILGNNVTAYGTDIPEQYVFFNKSGKIGLANITFYQNYMQYLNNMEGLLKYYNYSYVDSPTFSAIMQSISIYNNYVSKGPYLINETQNYVLNNSKLEYTMYSPFIYDIKVKLENYSYNTTIYTAGSTIQISG